MQVTVEEWAVSISQFFMFYQKTLMSDIAELPLKNLIK